jgi:hypothetical protein
MLQYNITAFPVLPKFFSSFPRKYFLQHVLGHINESVPRISQQFIIPMKTVIINEW